jgi:hypothetical protein
MAENFPVASHHCGQHAIFDIAILFRWATNMAESDKTKSTHWSGIFA